MTRNGIISAVKARLDELTSFQEGDALLEAEGLTKPVEQYVDDFLDEATDTVRLLCPERWMVSAEIPTKGDNDVSLLEEDTLPGSDVAYYRLPVPGNFLKVAKVLMSNWDRPCFSATLADGEGYRLLRNPHTTAGPAKPAVVVTGGKIALYGSRVRGATLSVALYIDKRHYDEDEDSMGQHGLVDEAIMWRCALLVLGIMGRADVLKQAETFYVEAVRQLVNG
jgi:hypothetical protein